MSEAPAATAVPTGNTYDKYGSTNPVVKRLMSNFHRALDELWEIARPESVLDVGCGEGVLTCQWAERLPDGRVVGIDLDDPKLRAEWDTRQRPNLEYRAEEATALSFDDDEFDLAAAIEVLEHVPEPETTLSEMARGRSQGQPGPQGLVTLGGGGSGNGSGHAAFAAAAHQEV